MTIFFFSHAHEQIERENKNKARKKDSFPHFRAELALKSPQTLALPSKKPKVMSNYPFLNNWKCFPRGSMAGQLMFAFATWLHNTWEKFYEKSS